MRYHNPLLFLVGIVLAFFLLASLARAEDQFDEDARAAIAVALALEEVKVKAVDPPCGIDGCKCGCAEGGVCTCSAAKQKSWRSIAMRGEGGAIFWFVSNRDYPVPSDSPHYNTNEEAQTEADRRNGKKYKAGDSKNGYTCADDGYWYKDEPAPVYDHYFPPEAYSQWSTRQVEPSQMQRLLFSPQQLQGFGGVRGSPRGCAGGS